MTRAEKMRRLQDELERKYGPALVMGKTQREREELQRGAAMQALLTGSTVCYSLTDTVQNGGC